MELTPLTRTGAAAAAVLRERTQPPPSSACSTKKSAASPRAAKLTESTNLHSSPRVVSSSFNHASALPHEKQGDPYRLSFCPAGGSTTTVRAQLLTHVVVVEGRPRLPHASSARTSSVCRPCQTRNVRLRSGPFYVAGLLGSFLW
jgi:hypothetical protein